MTNVWREKVARGDVIIVRYADDAVLGFQYREDADRFLEQLRQRLHASPEATVKWLIAVVRGYFQYHAVPGNEQRLWAFRNDVLRGWLCALRRPRVCAGGVSGNRHPYRDRLALRRACRGTQEEAA